jgi:predicted ATPase/DNA-binding SARP family transcriptional activator
MRYGILGPLELSYDGRAVEIAGAKQRALLAMLLLNANRVVSSDQLVDAIWEEQVPDTASKALQVHVSQLRKLLGKHRLETRAPGYLLRVEQDALDLERFQRLYGEGELDEALSLWRGPPLAEFAYQRFAQAEIARLQELRLGCLEDRIDRDLAWGRHAELIGELEGLVMGHPLREQLRCQLMLALYRAGRQAEALDSYQQARAVLIGDLGIEPGRQLRELHQAILNQDPSLDLPAQERREYPEPEPPAVPPPTSTAKPITRDVRKTVTAVFVWMAFSSAPGEVLDPEALRRVTGRAFGEVELAVVRHGGTIETVAGDGLTAVFGVPMVHEDDALRGVRAAAEARDALSILAAELAIEQTLDLDFRIGISTGEVVSVIDAGPQLRTTGEPLRLSARLGQAAGPGEILFDEGSRQLLRDSVLAEATNEGWRLLKVASGAGIARRLVSPMVGRERERRRLYDAFEQAVGDRSCQLFTVLGPAGVGKSRLVQEFLDGIAGQAVVARGRCLPYGEGITYWPLLEAVNEAVGLEDTDPPDEARAKLLGALGTEPGAELVAHRVAEMVGLAEVTTGAEEGFVAVRQLFEALARVQPLVLVFDDIHWGEARFLDLVEHLADWVREAPVQLVCLARPELLSVRPSWGGGKLNATVALLEPLSDEECSQLIENLVGRAELVRGVRTRIAEAAEGNPLFVEEMLSMLIDDGLLVREGGRWTAARDISTVRVPPTIQALLAARLDQLDGSERAVIERASVVGKVFQEGAVAELSSPVVLPTVADSLGTLVRKDLIRPERVSLGDRTYRFRHLLIRDAAYDSIPKEVRTELHERFGRWLEHSTGERAIEYEEVIGYHLEQAYRYRVELGAVDDAARALAREAAERLGSAGRRAFVRSDAPAGANLIARAAALLPPDDPLRVELVPNVRVVQGLGGDMGWADRVLTEAVEAAATTGNRQLAARALVQRGLLRLFTESNVTADELIDAADRSIAVFDELGDELGLARAWRLKAQAHYLARRAGACADASERAFEHVRRTDDRFEEQEIVEWLLIALLLGPAPAEEASRRCQLLLRETANNPLVEAQVLATMGMLAAMSGRLDEANDLVVRSRAIMNDAGQWIWIVTFWYAFVSVWQGNTAAAEQELLPGYEALKKMGEKSHFSSIAHELSSVLYLQGRYDEAEQLTRECEEATRANDIHSGILWRSIRAKILARRGEFEAAEQLAGEALAIASTSDFHIAHADALLDLAEVLALAGNPSAVPALVREAIGFYELKGNLLAAERAVSQLDDLS